jgi:hypothetical protein
MVRRDPMDCIRARVKELSRRGLQVDQAVVEKYLIHPGEEFSPEPLSEVPVVELDCIYADLERKEE